MLNEKPTWPIKGKTTVPVNGRRILVLINNRDKQKRDEIIERIYIIKRFFPTHYLKTGNRHYLSIEAFNETMEELRKL